MSLYKTGTVALTNNSNAVTGTGTSWLTEVAVGDSFKRTGENAIYSIASIPSNTSLTLTVVYAGVTGSGLSYSIGRDFTPIEGIPETDASDPDMPYRITTALRKIDEVKAPLASPVFTTQITTPKIVTASGGLTITPAGDANIILQETGTGKVGVGGTLFNAKFGVFGSATNIIATFGNTANNNTAVSLSDYDSSGMKVTYSNATTGAPDKDLIFHNGTLEKMRITGGGYLALGMFPTVQFELSGSVGQKATGTTWSNPSDERLKTIIGPADLQRCYDDVKALPLLRYKLKDDCFEGKQATDRTLTGFTANDVQKVIPKAVNVVPFTKVAIPDGEEEYQEQEFVMEQVEVEEVELVAEKPILVKKLKEQKRLLADDVQVEDEAGNKVVFKDKDGATRPLIHSIPRMITKIRPKEKKDVIEDCLNLDMSQVYMQMFGAVQLLIQKVEALEAKSKVK